MCVRERERERKKKSPPWHVNYLLLSMPKHVRLDDNADNRSDIRSSLPRGVMLQVQSSESSTTPPSPSLAPQTSSRRPPTTYSPSQADVEGRMWCPDSYFKLASMNILVLAMPSPFSCVCVRVCVYPCVWSMSFFPLPNLHPLLHASLRFASPSSKRQQPNTSNRKATRETIPTFWLSPLEASRTPKPPDESMDAAAYIKTGFTYAGWPAFVSWTKQHHVKKNVAKMLMVASLWRGSSTEPQSHVTYICIASWKDDGRQSFSSSSSSATFIIIEVGRLVQIHLSKEKKC